MSLVVTGASGGVGGTGGAPNVAAVGMLDKLKEIGCPHGPNCKFGPTCNLNLAFGGPVNANFWIDAEKRKKMLKERADWEKKHGVTGLKLVGPSKSEQQAAKKRAEEGVKWLDLNTLQFGHASYH